jgi:hypothetical protein
MPGSPGELEHAMTDLPEPELYGDEHEPIEDDAAVEVIDGEHPDGDYPQHIYDDDPDEPILDEPAIEEGED